MCAVIYQHCDDITMCESMWTLFETAEAVSLSSRRCQRTVVAELNTISPDLQSHRKISRVLTACSIGAGPVKKV